MMRPPTLAVIIVSWNVRDLLRRCLQAVAASLAGSNIAYELLVVDNASGDGTPAMLRADFPHVRLLEPGANLGFAGGNNLALRAILDSRQGDKETRRQGALVGAQAGLPASGSPSLLVSGSPDYVLLLNPDTEPVGDAIPRLVRELEARPELAVVGPQLRYGDGALQPSRRRFPGRATLFWESTALDRLWPNNPWARRYRYADRDEDMPQHVDWLVGAALLVRAAAVRRAGLLDERFFMYSEELEWQRRIQQAWGGAAICYLPEATIVHHEGKSSEQAVAGRHLNFSHSKLLLARMWFGWGYARLLRDFLRLGFVYELSIERLKLLLSHAPTLRRARIAVYREVLQEL